MRVAVRNRNIAMTSRIYQLTPTRHATDERAASFFFAASPKVDINYLPDSSNTIKISPANSPCIVHYHLAHST